MKAKANHDGLHNKDLVWKVPELMQELNTEEPKKISKYIEANEIMSQKSGDYGEKLLKDVRQVIDKIKAGLPIGEYKGKGLDPGKPLVLPSRDKLRMTFKYVRRNEKPALTLKGSTLINFGEIFCLVGLPGHGKSAVCEAIVCSHLGKDSFGFQFSTKGKKVLFIDTERPPDDVSTSYNNIARRLGKPTLDKAGEIAGLIHLTLSEFGRVDELKAILERELSSEEFDLVLLDGILDFSLSMNDDADATQVVKWVRALAVRYNCGVVVTIHPNKGSESLAGHLGSFLSRWCRAVLFVRNVKGDKSIKEITGDPEMSKLSHADLGSLPPVYFKWDDKIKLLTECQYLPLQPRGKEDKMKKAFESVFVNGDKMRYSELVKALIKNGNKDRTAKRWIKDATGMSLKKAGEFYSINQHNDLFK